MSRIAQEFQEPVAEGTDEARASGLMAEVAVTENAQARASGLMAEVAVTENAQARASGLMAEVIARESYLIRSPLAFAEAFCVPTGAKDQVRYRQGINTVQGVMSHLQGNKWKLLPGQRG